MSETRTNPYTQERVTHSIVMVDADVAKRWLLRNVKNRKLRQTIVQRYRNDMAAGRWAFAADPIRFSTDGDLLDGQHRLHAIAELDGLTIPMLVVRGLPEAAQGYMDQGGRRTPGDQLSLKGYPNSNALAAAVKQYLIWQDGYMFRDNKAATAAVTTPRIEEWVAANPESTTRYTALHHIVRQNFAPPSIAGAAAIRFAQLDESATVEFFTLLARGAGTDGHPIVTLDKRLARLRREGLKMSNRDILSLFILAWNAWREGRQMAKFQRPRGGAWTEETFPVPR